MDDQRMNPRTSSRCGFVGVHRRRLLSPFAVALILAAMLALCDAPTLVHAESSTAPTRTTETIVKRQKTGGPGRTSTTTSTTTGGTPEAHAHRESEPFDWESPDTWGAVATGGGFVVAAGALFVGFI